MKNVVSAHGDKLIEMDHVIEGRDYQRNELVAIIKFGFRTEEQAVGLLIASGLHQTDIALAVQDTWCNPEQFHLDHYACLLRDTLLIDTKRAEDIYRSKVCIYRRTPSGWRVTEDNLTLLNAAKIVGIDPVLLDEGLMNAWCANAFSIGDHIWIDNAVPPRFIELLSAPDYNIHTLFPNIKSSLVAFTDLLN